MTEPQQRAKAGARQRIEISPALIEQFGCTMQEKLLSGGNTFRQAYISAIVDRIEVDDVQVRIIVRKEVLEQAVKAIVAAGSGVRVLYRSGAP